MVMNTAELIYVSSFACTKEFANNRFKAANCALAARSRRRRREHLLVEPAGRLRANDAEHYRNDLGLSTNVFEAAFACIKAFTNNRFKTGHYFMGWQPCNKEGVGRKKLAVWTTKSSSAHQACTRKIVRNTFQLQMMSVCTPLYLKFLVHVQTFTNNLSKLVPYLMRWHPWEKRGSWTQGLDDPY